MAPADFYTGPKSHIESSLKRVRVLFGGTFIIDTNQAKLVWEQSNYPTYFFPHSALHEKYLHSRLPPAQATSTSSARNESLDLIVGNHCAERVVTRYFDELSTLKGLLKIAPFGAMDGWFEEDEQIFVHPKDPYKRVDVLQSSKHIRIEINGVELANTTKPRLLFETSQPLRTYIPKTDCRLEYLLPSRLTTQCPYKGVASYYQVQLPTGQSIENIVWWYRNPQSECAEIKGYVAFADEFVDTWVDGKEVPRPTNSWA